eukprot:174071-Amphidinium_carterae.1
MLRAGVNEQQQLGFISGEHAHMMPAIAMLLCADSTARSSTQPGKDSFMSLPRNRGLSGSLARVGTLAGRRSGTSFCFSARSSHDLRTMCIALSHQFALLDSCQTTLCCSLAMRTTQGATPNPGIDCPFVHTGTAR